MSAGPAPLAGLRVLDLSRVLAGPYCTMALADLGADVVKVERPGTGDETRAWGPPWAGGEAAYYLSVNRSKRSCAIDLQHPEGSRLALALAACADVVIENFKAGGAAELGLSYEHVRAVRPDVVYCSITGFGSGREPADRPGYDFVAQAESGLMHITGPADGEPSTLGVAVVDVLCGLNAAVAILAALRRREATGAGEHIEVSLLDSALAALVNVAANTLVSGREAERYGNAHPNIVPYQTIRAADGWVALAVGNDATFARLCEVLERPELAADPRYATNAERVRHRDTLIVELEAILVTRPAEEWVIACERAGVPAGKIRGVREALQAAADAGVPATTRVPHPTAGAVQLVNPAFRLREAPLQEMAAPPLLGQHTADVLGELGLETDQLEALARMGVIAEAAAEPVPA
jgi:crotonobetainyl-CoA:carnitine CoA-transferase CaiB-like acyl-CoA transferase